MFILYYLLPVNLDALSWRKIHKSHVRDTLIDQGADDLLKRINVPL